MIYQSIIDIAEICNKKNVHHVVLSPGSRCAPLSLGFIRHPRIETKIISDERSAAFIALGMADQLKHPVGLVCTSGSAAFNYAPAIAEAFFRQIPLLVFTADRPPEWIDQLDGQTIRQENIYLHHVKKSFDFPVDTQHPDAQWYSIRIISEAINLSRSPIPGPVHINIPVREPLYPDKNEKITYNKAVKVIEESTSVTKTDNVTWQKITSRWNDASTKLILAGQYPVDRSLEKVLQTLSNKQKVPVVGDVIANLHNMEEAIHYHDIVLAKALKQEDPQFSPELLITYGLSVLSKNLKLYMRKFPPREHWHIVPGGQAPDTYQALTHVIHCRPLDFFSDLEQENLDIEANQSKFYQTWESHNKLSFNKLKGFFDNSTDSGEDAGEFMVVKTVLDHLPADVHLHLANSMPVRYANFLAIPPGKVSEVFANRGTSGIDGSNSTAVGTYLAGSKKTVLLTGDMAFFYDRNAFWHNYPLSGLYIIILNNHGGGIFRIIGGPDRQPELEEYFETYQALQADNTARDFNMDYFQCNLFSRGDLPDLRKQLNKLFSEPAENGKILEIFTDTKTNKSIFAKFQQIISDNYAT